MPGRPTARSLLSRFACNLRRPRTWAALVAIELGVAVGWWRFGWFGGVFGLLATGLLLGDLLVAAPPGERGRGRARLRAEDPVPGERP